MKQKNNIIFITGATGKIGKVLIKELLDKDYKIKALVRDPSNINIQNNLEIIKGDICDRKIIDKALLNCDSIIHLAAYQNPNNENEKEFYRVNVEGTKILLDLAKKRNIQKFLYISTAMVFESTGKIPRNEKWRVNDKEKYNLYVKSKVEALNIVRKYFIKVPTIILYPTVVVDALEFNSENLNMKGWQKVMLKTIGGGVPGGLMSLIGDKNRIINIIFIDNLVEAIINALYKGKKGDDYILGGVNITVDNYLKEIAKIKKIKRFPFRFPLFIFKFISLFKLPGLKIFELIAQNPPQDLCFDSRKAQNTLGLKIRSIKDSVL